MLRVLTLSTLFPDATRPGFGGFVERQTLGLAALPDVEVTVVAPVGQPPWPLRRLQPYRALADLPTSESWKGVAVHRPRFGTVPGTKGLRHAAALEAAVVPVLRDIAFDVIDASFFFPDGPAAVALGRRFGVPVSIKARGGDIHYWGSVRVREVREAGRQADGLLAVGEALKADMVALGMPGDRITVHRTGVDRDRFHPRDRAAEKLALGIGGPLVASVGALTANKGHAIVIEAIAALPGVTLAILGAGPERGALTGLAERLGIADRVRLLGAVPHDEAARWVGAADVMALASATEGLANAWVEALASGTPVIAPDVGSAREVLTLSAGRIVPREASAFADAIGSVLRDPPRTEAVTAAAAPFSWETNARELRAHLLALVQASRG
jgi:glycosyltransferase involved in cell wall biosynthesis